MSLLSKPSRFPRHLLCSVPAAAACALAVLVLTAFPPSPVRGQDAGPNPCVANMMCDHQPTASVAIVGNPLTHIMTCDTISVTADDNGTSAGSASDHGTPPCTSGSTSGGISRTWQLSRAGTPVDSGTGLSFSRAGLAAGEYSLTFTVTASGPSPCGSSTASAGHAFTVHELASATGAACSGSVTVEATAGTHPTPGSGNTLYVACGTTAAFTAALSPAGITASPATVPSWAESCSGTTGTGFSFSATFDTPGDCVVTVSACGRTATINVKVTKLDSIRSTGCAIADSAANGSPATAVPVPAGTAVSLEALMKDSGGGISSDGSACINWTASGPNANPTSGTGGTFATSLQDPGHYTITAACPCGLVKTICLDAFTVEIQDLPDYVGLNNRSSGCSDVTDHIETYADFVGDNDTWSFLVHIEPELAQPIRLRVEGEHGVTVHYAKAPQLHLKDPEIEVSGDEVFHVEGRTISATPAQAEVKVSLMTTAYGNCPMTPITDSTTVVDVDADKLAYTAMNPKPEITITSPADGASIDPETISIDYTVKGDVLTEEFSTSDSFTIPALPGNYAWSPVTGPWINRLHNKGIAAIRFAVAADAAGALKARVIHSGPSALAVTAPPSDAVATLRVHDATQYVDSAFVTPPYPQGKRRFTTNDIVTTHSNIELFANPISPWYDFQEMTPGAGESLFTYRSKGEDSALVAYIMGSVVVGANDAWPGADPGASVATHHDASDPDLIELSFAGIPGCAKTGTVTWSTSSTLIRLVKPDNGSEFGAALTFPFDTDADPESLARAVRVKVEGLQNLESTALEDITVSASAVIGATSEPRARFAGVALTAQHKLTLAACRWTEFRPDLAPGVTGRAEPVRVNEQPPCIRLTVSLPSGEPIDPTMPIVVSGLVRSFTQMPAGVLINGVEVPATPSSTQPAGGPWTAGFSVEFAPLDGAGFSLPPITATYYDATGACATAWIQPEPGSEVGVPVSDPAWIGDTEANRLQASFLLSAEFHHAGQAEATAAAAAIAAPLQLQPGARGLFRSLKPVVFLHDPTAIPVNDEIEYIALRHTQPLALGCQARDLNGSGAAVAAPVLVADLDALLPDGAEVVEGRENDTGFVLLSGTTGSVILRALPASVPAGTQITLSLSNPDCIVVDPLWNHRFTKDDLVQDVAIPVTARLPGVTVISATLNSKDGAVPATTVHLRLQVAAPVNITIDSNNDGELTEEDVAIEDAACISGSACTPGLYLPANLADTDHDAVPNFADGLDLYGNAGANASASFEPVLVTIPPEVLTLIDPLDVSLEFIYPAADPADLQRDASVPGRVVYRQNGGRLRLWTKDGPESRFANSISDNLNPGDFVPAATWHSLASLGQSIVPGTWLLFLEGITPDAQPACSWVGVRLHIAGVVQPAAYSSDFAKLTIIGTDLDVNSDNNTDTIRTAWEDTIEDAYVPADPARYPGVAIILNNGDTDCDGIVDFADGMDLFDQSLTIANQSAAFTPVTLELPGSVDTNTAIISFQYAASDPAGVQPAAGDCTCDYQPAPGYLRLWTKNGNIPRRSASVPAGDFLAPDTAFTCAQLGLTAQNRTVTLYLEGVAVSPVEPLRVAIDVDTDGSTGPAATFELDAFRATVMELWPLYLAQVGGNLLEVGFDRIGRLRLFVFNAAGVLQSFRDLGTFPNQDPRTVACTHTADRLVMAVAAAAGNVKLMDFDADGVPVNTESVVDTGGIVPSALFLTTPNLLLWSVTGPAPGDGGGTMITGLTAKTISNGLQPSGGYTIPLQAMDVQVTAVGAGSFRILARDVADPYKVLSSDYAVDGTQLKPPSAGWFFDALTATFPLDGRNAEVRHLGVLSFLFRYRADHNYEAPMLWVHDGVDLENPLPFYSAGWWQEGQRWTTRMRSPTLSFDHRGILWLTWLENGNARRSLAFCPEPDFDMDGMSDTWELANGLDPLHETDAAFDPDGDTLDNRTEFRNSGDPNNTDTDDDGLSDDLELAMGYAINDWFSFIDSEDNARDYDGDGWPNYLEVNLGSDPLDPNSMPQGFKYTPGWDAAAADLLPAQGFPRPGDPEIEQPDTTMLRQALAQLAAETTSAPPGKIWAIMSIGDTSASHTECYKMRILGYRLATPILGGGKTGLAYKLIALNAPVATPYTGEITALYDIGPNDPDGDYDADLTPASSCDCNDTLVFTEGQSYLGGHHEDTGLTPPDSLVFRFNTNYRFIQITQPATVPRFVRLGQQIQVNVTTAGLPTGGTFAWATESGPASLAYADAAAQLTQASAPTDALGSMVPGAYVARVSYTKDGTSCTAKSGQLWFLAVNTEMLRFDGTPITEENSASTNTPNETNPGAFIRLNNDDDSAGVGESVPFPPGTNGNGIADKDDAVTPVTPADGDLQPITLTMNPVPDTGVAQLQLPAAGARLWGSRFKDALPTGPWQLNDPVQRATFMNAVLGQRWVEGCIPGTPGGVVLRFQHPGATGCEDAVKITVMNVDLTIQNLPEYGAVNEESPGACVLLNDNDDCHGTSQSPLPSGTGNGTPDMNDPAPVTPVDPDLQAFRLTLDPVPQVGTVQLYLQNGDCHRLWNTGAKGAPIASLQIWHLDQPAERSAFTDFMADPHFVEAYGVGQSPFALTYTDPNGYAWDDHLNISTLQIGIAMDGNRDGSISFTDPADNKCVFWVNDDKDGVVFNTVPWENEWQEDDDAANTPNCDDDHIGWSASYTFEEGTVTGPWGMACLRDLEDFTRLHILVAPASGTAGTGLTCLLQMQTGSCQANIFPAVNASDQYLVDLGQAVSQVAAQGLIAVDGTARLLPSASIVTTGGQVSPFLLEGKTAGQGEMALLVKRNGVLLGQRSIKIDLRPVSSFFDHFAVPAVGSPCNLVSAGSGEFVDPACTDYMLFVHGYNVPPSTRAAWAATTYKRLWWQGYRGRFGYFDWPCVLQNLTDVAHFDRSEHYAWSCGAALAGCIASLDAAGRRICMLAHSQGGVVAGEALRHLPSPLVDTYVATQAAIGSDHYQAGLTPYFNPPPGMPPVIQQYPSTGQPFLAAAALNAVHRFNYHNFDDFALRTGATVGLGVEFGTWTWSNRNRPVTTLGYGYDTSTGFYRNWPLPLGLSFPADTYEIFAYAAPSHSHALGLMVGSVDGFAPAGNYFDLKQNLGYDDKHYSHSKQFRSNIVAEWRYWGRVADDMFLNRGYGPNPPSP